MDTGIADAIGWVHDYDGSFEFLLDMRARARRGDGFSDNQIAAITRCMERESKWAPASAEPVTEPGMYRAGENIFKVQAAKESGNLYAKRLVKIGGQRLSDEGERVRFEFQYEAGAVRSLKASERMTLEEAKAFGIQYGVCCVCGAFLKDATSVEQGIGPVCAGRL